MTLKITNLPIANYMTPYPITVNSKVSFYDAVGYMAERGFGNLIIDDDDGNAPKGILTEREILQAVSLGKDTSKITVGEMGSQSYVRISSDYSILEAAQAMILRKKRLLVFADNEKLVGIITASDMIRAFRKTRDAPSLDSVTSTDLVRCKYDDSILNAVRTMHEKRIGSVLIDDMKGQGIFTERDLLVHVLANEVDLDGKVGGYASSPLVVAEDSIKANKAASIMAAENIKRLGLTKDGTLIGIVTARDLVDAYQGAYKVTNSHLEELSEYVAG
ncbi:CBS domain-containing protein [Nitrosopumilus sp.]|uniref:CBS domain-containing protein n=1 Tax=Nitrosopumilus sp. TaxID=2024843 RepID=UPI00292CE838|nr:CBS domain-containing protein [Nitrosopumilus sp.]